MARGRTLLISSPCSRRNPYQPRLHQMDLQSVQVRYRPSQIHILRHHHRPLPLPTNAKRSNKFAQKSLRHRYLPVAHCLTHLRVCIPPLPWPLLPPHRQHLICLPTPTPPPPPPRLPGPHQRPPAIWRLFIIASPSFPIYMSEPRHISLFCYTSRIARSDCFFVMV